MAQAGRGGGGAKGGQGGAGRAGSGAGSTGGRDAAMGGGGSQARGGGNQFGNIGSGFGVGPGTQGPTKAPAMRDPSGAARGLPSNDTPLSGVPGALGGLFGYDTYGDLRSAYKSNPNRPGGKFANYTSYIPSFPNASPSVVAGAIFDALTSASPLGVASMLGRAAYSGATGEPMSTGWGMDAALAMGGTQGLRGPDVPGGGYERGGRGNAISPAGIGLAQGPTEQTASQPTPPTVQPTLANPYGTAQWQGGMHNIPGPSKYGVNLSSYPYTIWK